MPRTSKKSRSQGTKGKQVRRATIKPGSGPMHVMNLPVDVFLEIMAYCSPPDLLRLSRVSSELRSVLLAKRNKGVWVSARNSLDPPMPECPEDLSEPQYASLVFDRFCTACGAVGKEFKEDEDAAGPDTVQLTVSYAARVRLCRQCWTTNVKQGYTITNELDLNTRRDRSFKRVLFDLVPEARVARERSLARVTFYFGPEANDNMPIDHSARQTSRQNFYQPEVAAVAKEYRSLAESSGEDGKTVEEFIERRKAQTLERLDFHWAVAQWDYDRYKAKADAKLKVLRERRAGIEKRLKDLGYEPTDWLHLPEFETAVKRTEPFTEAAWDEMQQKLLAALSARRTLRETTEIREKYWFRASQLKAHYLAFLARDRTEHPWKRTLPHFVEASRLPCVRALVKGAPSPDTPLPVENFTAIEETLREEAQPYLQRVRADLARIFRLARAAELGVRWDGSADADLGVNVKVDGATGDPEAALLDVHDALFRCSSFPCSNFTRTAMMVSGLLEHWQKDHPYEWSGAQRIWLAGREIREKVPVLIEALGLPKDMTLSGLEDAVAGQSGSPTCVCGKLTESAVNRHEILDRLLRHLLPSQSTSEAPDVASVKHLITFNPTVEPTGS